MKHGTRSCYVSRRCRCDRCRAANTRYTGDWAKTRRQPRPLVPAGPTKIRMQALREIGIRPVDVASMLGYRNHYPTFLLNERITERNAERVRIVYEWHMRRHLRGEGVAACA